MQMAEACVIDYKNHFLQKVWACLLKTVKLLSQRDILR